jgi:hypothetical protein
MLANDTDWTDVKRINIMSGQDGEGKLQSLFSLDTGEKHLIIG